MSQPEYSVSCVCESTVGEGRCSLSDNHVSNELRVNLMSVTLWYLVDSVI